MKKFALLVNHTKDPGLAVTKAIRDYLNCAGASCLVPDKRGGQAEGTFLGIPADTECALTLGGDGTLLTAAQDLFREELDIPLFGINMGTLGFLTSAEQKDLPACLDCLLADKYIVDERRVITGTVLHEGQPQMTSPALNDIVVARAGYSRIVDLKIYVNEELLNLYSADGVIISTATGSTGYNLSAGGPIILPQTDVMVISPICPHSLQARSIIVPGYDEIRVEIGRRSKTQSDEAIATFDGQLAQQMQVQDCVTVRRADRTVKILRMPGNGLYRILRHKLGSVNQ